MDIEDQNGIDVKVWFQRLLDCLRLERYPVANADNLDSKGYQEA
jgi:hypothetical protein